MRPYLFALLLAGVLFPRPGAAQRLTLREALHRADSAAYANRGARAQASAARAQALGTLQGILPTLRAEGGWVKTTDPLNAFGFLLRQRGVTPAAFAPTLLNDPAPRANWTGGLVAEVPILDLDVWVGRGAARASASAAEAQARWSTNTTRLQVVEAFFGAMVAAEAARTLETADTAAADQLRQVTALLGQGQVTRSDLLLAEVRAGEIEAQLVGARAEAVLARRRLALTLGTPADTSFTLDDSLPSTERIRAFATASVGVTTGMRDDVRATDATATAAGRDALRAGARLLPRLNAFGRYDWNDPSRAFGGTKSWTIGVMASWTPFSGFAEAADLRGSRARAAAARALAEGTRATADLELAARESDVTVALARLEIAERAAAQGAEAHRLVLRRYTGGLVGITELLGAHAAEIQARLGLAEARYHAITALAARELARGADPTAITAVEEQ